MNPLKIAVINYDRADGMARTIIDGLCSLSDEGKIDFRLSSEFFYNLPIKNKVLGRSDFMEFASNANWIFLVGNDKYGYNKDLASAINRWNKTICIDGSEMGKNCRYDFTAQKQVLDGTYSGIGNVEKDLLKKCHRYFRREKPYYSGITPLPFGIETAYTKSYSKEVVKDIDFVCIFGQDEYPLMRRHAREAVEKYCASNNFICYTKKTKTPEEFYKILARAKVGISVGGGGFDTMRFWEILGNNCLLLTETIDIYNPGSDRLNYKRIWQFINLFDLEFYLEKAGKLLRDGYKVEDLQDEYREILKDHSSKARIEEILMLSENATT
jgi:hypothetical protein